MWYGNKLGDEYKTEISIPIEITFDYASLGWVENPNLLIKCLVEGKGTDLLQNSVMDSKVNIPLASLTLNGFEKTGMEFVYQISDQSLMEALRASQHHWQIFQILDTIPWIKITPMESVTLPIHGNVTLNCEKQFMVVGDLKLIPNTINVRAASSVLDTLQAIQTKIVEFNDLNQSINAGVELVIPPGVIASQREVRFTGDITGYTELEYNLPIEMVNLPNNYTVTCVPSTVSVIVRVPLRSFASHDIAKPSAVIDYNHRDTQRSNNFKVSVKNLPLGGEITSLKPEFVEPYFKRN